MIFWKLPIVKSSFALEAFYRSAIVLLLKFHRPQWVPTNWIELFNVKLKLGISLVKFIRIWNRKRLRLYKIKIRAFLCPNTFEFGKIRCSHRYRGGHGFESCWSLDFFQASSFQLLKLENLLRWSFFTLIYNRSSNVWIISYILHIINIQLRQTGLRWRLHCKAYIVPDM